MFTKAIFMLDSGFPCPESRTCIEPRVFDFHLTGLGITFRTTALPNRFPLLALTHFTRRSAPKLHNPPSFPVIATKEDLVQSPRKTFLPWA